MYTLGYRSLKLEVLHNIEILVTVKSRPQKQAQISHSGQRSKNRKWRTRRDSNARPAASEAATLSS